jgi:hypothetical protein
LPIHTKTKAAPPVGATFARGGFQPAADAARHVPSLAEADPEVYGALTAKVAELNARLSEANAALREAERALAAHEGPSIRASVADLLGDDATTGRAAKAAAVRDARQRVADIEAAITIAGHRLRDAKSAAVRAVVAKVRPEWQKRIKALTSALEATRTAHIALHDLRQAIEHEDVDAALFGPWPYFLGDARDSKIDGFLKEVQHAG